MIALQGGDRNPLIGAVMSGTGGAELDCRYPGPDEGERVRGPVPADRGHRAVVVPCDRFAEPLDPGRVGATVDRRQHDDRLDSVGSEFTDLTLDLDRVLVR